MPIGRLKSDNAVFGSIRILAHPPGQAGKVWREVQCQRYVTLHRLHLVLEAAFNLSGASDYEIDVDHRVYGPGHISSRNKLLIDFLSPFKPLPERFLYRRQGAELEVHLKERSPDAQACPRLLTGAGAWQSEGGVDLDAAQQRLEAMRPL